MRHTPAARRRPHTLSRASTSSFMLSETLVRPMRVGTSMQNPSTVDPTPPPLPAPTAPTPPSSPGPGGPVIVTLPPEPGRLLTRQEIAAIRARREELSDQLTSAARRRARLADELKTADPAAREGLEQRIRVLDERIVRLEQDIAETGRLLTSANAGSLVLPPVASGGGINSSQFTAIAIVFTVLVLFPLAIAWSRLLWRRATGQLNPAASKENSERLTRLEQAVDTVAVEMERVSEGQRFITKLLMEPNAIAALESGSKLGESQREKVGQREKV